YTGASAVIVKGVRRCGKSTLLKQILERKFPNSYHYFNFDDDRIIDFKTEDFQTLMEVLTELSGVKKVLAFDEIQNIKGWELFVNRLLREGYHVYVTGSNANLLSKELGTHLTGRHVDIELYPFSFSEFLDAKKIPLPKKKFYSTDETAILSKTFKEYLNSGGMPEAVVFSNEAVLTQILRDIIQKDILTRYDIRQSSVFKTVLNFLIANAANPITFRSVLKNFGLKSATTVQKYIEYMEETYIIFSIKRYEKKIKLLDKNPRKIYCIDNGIIRKNSSSLIENVGQLLENLVAIHLKNYSMECYYYKSSTDSEADFVVPKEKLAIQVCYELNSGNMEREAKGLIEAMHELKTKNGIILTLDQEHEFSFRGHKIFTKPVWKWLLENEPNKMLK
ncbi:MAG: ATP-binding protein, partial [Candidatus Micrarchaeota archaeon]|nr:ATP-binding protein [Candidatus Micrarchaeota archaeon]